jgi:hypothetical protein
MVRGGPCLLVVLCDGFADEEEIDVAGFCFFNFRLVTSYPPRSYARNRGDGGVPPAHQHQGRYQLRAEKEQEAYYESQ